MHLLAPRACIEIALRFEFRSIQGRLQILVKMDLLWNGFALKRICFGLGGLGRIASVAVQ